MENSFRPDIVLLSETPKQVLLLKLKGGEGVGRQWEEEWEIRSAGRDGDVGCSNDEVQRLQRYPQDGCADKGWTQAWNWSLWVESPGCGCLNSKDPKLPVTPGISHMTFCKRVGLKMVPGGTTGAYPSCSESASSSQSPISAFACLGHCSRVPQQCSGKFHWWSAIRALTKNPPLLRSWMQNTCAWNDNREILKQPDTRHFQQKCTNHFFPLSVGDIAVCCG